MRCASLVRSSCLRFACARRHSRIPAAHRTDQDERAKTMRGRGVVFTGPEQAELEEVAIDPSDLKPGEALVRAEYSIISAGTEGASYTNLMPQTPPIYRSRPVIYPARTGYGHVGEVLAVGSDVIGIKPGDRVLTFSRHAGIVRANAARFA